MHVRILKFCFLSPDPLRWSFVLLSLVWEEIPGVDCTDSNPAAVSCTHIAGKVGTRWKNRTTNWQNYSLKVLLRCMVDLTFHQLLANADTVMFFQPFKGDPTWWHWNLDNIAAVIDQSLTLCLRNVHAVFKAGWGLLGEIEEHQNEDSPHNVNVGQADNGHLLTEKQDWSSPIQTETRNGQESEGGGSSESHIITPRRRKRGICIVQFDSPMEVAVSNPAIQDGCGAIPRSQPQAVLENQVVGDAHPNQR